MLVTFHSRDHYNSPTSCCSLNAHVELALERRERHVKATNRLTEARSVPANWMSQGSGRSGRIIQLPFVYHCKPEPSARMNDHSVVFVPCALASPGLPRPPRILLFLLSTTEDSLAWTVQPDAEQFVIPAIPSLRTTKQPMRSTRGSGGVFPTCPTRHLSACSPCLPLSRYNVGSRGGIMYPILDLSHIGVLQGLKGRQSYTQNHGVER